MFNYKNVDIKFEEHAQNYSSKDGSFTVTSDGMIYVAESKCGVSFGSNPETALNGAKKQIDSSTK